jgi:hypothetical protein
VVAIAPVRETGTIWIWDRGVNAPVALEKRKISTENILMILIQKLKTGIQIISETCKQ